MVQYRDTLSFSVIHNLFALIMKNYVDTEIRSEHYGVALSEAITMTLEMNLDCMQVEELWSIWKRSNSVRPIAFARELFPDAPKGYVRATKDLGNYAANKATEMRLRLSGQIQSAFSYEAICDRIYEQLPEYARW